MKVAEGFKTWFVVRAYTVRDVCAGYASHESLSAAKRCRARWRSMGLSVAVTVRVQATKEKS